MTSYHGRAPYWALSPLERAERDLESLASYEIGRQLLGVPLTWEARSAMRGAIERRRLAALFEDAPAKEACEAADALIARLRGNCGGKGAV